ncbi:unnamed protein product [Spirodela intermedia]|uniref:Bulb-type lectin domain-containing protein n=1 Tax=Spirodela intermedia TaxID=51605 RepID=A0A7I8IHH3_SPIIN|nr:unnamed protein product [Spirodela intermedia]CAA6656523.1 unnamed protein product [Spirodela intermedia]
MAARKLISLPLLILLCLLSSPCSARNTLRSGQTLTQRQSLNYNNYVFTMQSDCNLVLGTNCRATMQSDGNFVIYTGSRAVWATNTNGGIADYVLILQPDRNVVIYEGARAIWATGTNVFGAGVTIAPRKNVTSTLAAPAVKNP